MKGLRSTEIYHDTAYWLQQVTCLTRVVSASIEVFFSGLLA